MTQEVQIPDDVMDMVRKEAKLQGRSVADQIAHWVKLGRALERSPNFDYARVSAALESEIDTAGLTELEDALWVELFTDSMGKPGPEEEAFFARRRRFGLGVGLDAAAKLVYQDPE
ncbi:hypothetical protein AB9K35_22020 [Leisingera sp. XS_AS12]|uniref:TA system antitoxin ParD family protein n=1 Tax=Leisingera sp. XS_AS12 TaxID=3241294 RepID=UPI0035166135